MSWSRAATLALVPWALFLGALVPYQIWNGMADHYGWADFAKRMISIAVILYCSFTIALRMRGRV
ncbi:hypothetical protein ATE67_02050 [Sphingopyxis sp. H050]|jgi:hypothetical protein|uniref:hypothetical protein n=1 Tax=Sphingopyxis sp. H050 TaxID=1759072 RepID=UPI000736D317|nr:hypothetical protein [Sphingopyxis sp. H050]KTE22733.1 hypothetical protein ATE67_02050 [Sphingopyxis sp. H050]